jgi:hypothetical protein
MLVPFTSAGFSLHCIIRCCLAKIKGKSNLNHDAHCRQVIENRAGNSGGEGGIRSLPYLTASITCRNYIATNAKFTTLAAHHCTLLHAARKNNEWTNHEPVEYFSADASLGVERNLMVMLKILETSSVSLSDCPSSRNGQNYQPRCLVEPCQNL